MTRIVSCIAAVDVLMDPRQTNRQNVVTPNDNANRAAGTSKIAFTLCRRMLSQAVHHLHRFNLQSTLCKESISFHEVAAFRLAFRVS